MEPFRLSPEREEFDETLAVKFVCRELLLFSGDFAEDDWDLEDELDEEEDERDEEEDEDEWPEDEDERDL